MCPCIVNRGGDGEAGRYGGSLNSRPSHVLTNMRLGVDLVLVGVLLELCGGKNVDIQIQIVNESDNHSDLVIHVRRYIILSFHISLES